MAAVRTAACVLLAVSLAGCGPGHATLPVAWQFADGRRCSDSSVSQVVLYGAASCKRGDAGPGACAYDCAAGEAGQHVAVDLDLSAALLAQGQSLAGDPLYRGQGTPTAGQPVALTLYFTGGR